MKTYLYTWNPSRQNWGEQPEAIKLISNGSPYHTDWSCGKTKKIEPGDAFLLMRLGVDPRGIIGCGHVLSGPVRVPHWDKVKAADGKTMLKTQLAFEVLSEEPVVSLSDLQQGYPDVTWTPLEGGLLVPEEAAVELLAAIRGAE